jgi:hypothetical protein
LSAGKTNTAAGSSPRWKGLSSFRSWYLTTARLAKSIGEANIRGRDTGVGIGCASFIFTLKV